MLRRWKLHEVSYLFALPALLFYCFFFIYPSLQSFYFSLTDWNGLNPHFKFIGLDNFRALMDETEFIAAFKNTLFYAVALTIGQMCSGLLLAMLISRGSGPNRLFRMIFFSPQVISLLAIGYIWSYFMDPVNGSLNAMLRMAGMPFLEQNWLGSFRLAIWSVVGVSIWQGAGWCMVIFLANLQSIPKELHESASIDGATGAQKFWRITLPLLAPAMTITLVTGMISGLKMFDLIMVMTKGGPGYATESISSIIYVKAFAENRFAEATAIGILMFLLILIVTSVQLRVLKRREVEL